MKAVDTNVLVRFIVADDEEQVRRAIRFLTRESSAENPCFVNRVVLSEFVWVLQTAYRYSRERVAHAVERLLNTYQLLIEDRDEASAALDEYRNGADFADIFVARINRRLRCDYTATFDRKAARRPDFRLL
jgi:predicted nucleic-acid-binding protein